MEIDGLYKYSEGSICWATKAIIRRQDVQMQRRHNEKQQEAARRSRSRGDTRHAEDDGQFEGDRVGVWGRREFPFGRDAVEEALAVNRLWLRAHLLLFRMDRAWTAACFAAHHSYLLNSLSLFRHITNLFNLIQLIQSQYCVTFMDINYSFSQS